MDLGRPKQATGTEMPNPSVAVLENVVRSHSTQLTKLNAKLVSAFSQVTGEMGELRTSTAATTTTLSSLAGQVAALTDMVARISQTLAPEPNPAPPRVVPASPAPVVPEGESPEPRWEPHLPPPKPYTGEFDRCQGFLGLSQLQFQGTAHARPALPVLREGGAHHPGLPGSAKRPGSQGRGVLVSRADFMPPSGGTNSLFPAILAWGLETLSAGVLLRFGGRQVPNQRDPSPSGQYPPRTHGCYPIRAGARRSLHG